MSACQIGYGLVLASSTTARAEVLSIVVEGLSPSSEPVAIGRPVRLSRILPNSPSCCSWPLQVLLTAASSICLPHWASRLADHIDSRPMPWTRANESSVRASPSVKTSSLVSFWPIMGVAPTLAQTWALVSVVPEAR